LKDNTSKKGSISQKIANKQHTPIHIFFRKIFQK